MTKPNPSADWAAFKTMVATAIKLGGYGKGKAVQLERVPGPLRDVSKDEFSVTIGGEAIAITREQWRALVVVVFDSGAEF